MYHPFIQFTIPKVGQGLIAVVLYLNFLQLPFVAMFSAAMPLLYFGIPLLLMALLSYISRDPLGPGMVFAGHLTVFYFLCNGLSLLFRFVGGAPQQAWRVVYAGGLLPWLATGVLMLYGSYNAKKLRLTTYKLQTHKALPAPTLRLVQISDLHPGATTNHTRIPELRAMIDSAAPDIIVFTGDIFDEYTQRAEFEAFCAFFGTLTPRWGKYFVYGNHDLGHHWREPSYDRAALESAFAKAGVRVLEDVAVLTQTTPPLRIVGRKDWLYTGHDRRTPASLLPGGADEIYTILLDHEPLELADDAKAGADLMLCGHTHGGQIWPAGLLTRLVRYSDLNYGLKHYPPHSAAIVSGGTGTWGYRIRTEGKTELVAIEITSLAAD